MAKRKINPKKKVKENYTTTLRLTSQERAKFDSVKQILKIKTDNKTLIEIINNYESLVKESIELKWQISDQKKIMWEIKKTYEQQDNLKKMINNIKLVDMYADDDNNDDADNY